MAAAILTTPIVAPDLTVKTDELYDRFPTYVDPFDSSEDTVADSDDVMTMSSASPSAPASPSNKLVDKLRDGPSRHASPQPTSVSHAVPAKVSGNGYRVLRSATVGYIAPAFVGKADQMQEGKRSHS